MELVHYLILAGVAAVVLVTVLAPPRPSSSILSGARPKDALRSAFRDLDDLAEERAYERLKEEIAERRAGELKVEIQSKFAPKNDKPAS